MHTYTFSYFCTNHNVFFYFLTSTPPDTFFFFVLSFISMTLYTFNEPCRQQRKPEKPQQPRPLTHAFSFRMICYVCRNSYYYYYFIFISSVPYICLTIVLFTTNTKKRSQPVDLKGNEVSYRMLI